MASRRRALLVLIDAARRDLTEAAWANSCVPALAEASRATLVAPSCWTLPSIGSLLTGRFPSEHGLAWPFRRTPSPLPSLVSMMREAGREFRLISANSMYAPPLLSSLEGVADFPLRRFSRLSAGLRRVFGVLDYGGRMVLGEVDSLTVPTVPDLLVLHLNEAHHPYLPPPRGLSPGRRLQYGLGHLAYYLQKRAQVWEFAAHASVADWARTRQRYAECLAHDIRIVELIIQGYAAAGLLEDTLIIITADHGEHLGEHGLADHQASLYEELVNVPCAIIGPGIPPGTRIPGQFQHTDLLLTLCGFLGVPLAGYEPRWQPLDVLDTANWHGGHEHTFMEWTAWGEHQLAKLMRRNPSYDFAPLNRDLVGVRTNEWKYIRAADGSQALFNLHEDTGETRDVAEAHPRTVAELEARLAEWQTAVLPRDDEQPTACDGPGGYDAQQQALIEQRLADLGYL